MSRGEDPESEVVGVDWAGEDELADDEVGHDQTSHDGEVVLGFFAKYGQDGENGQLEDELGDDVSKNWGGKEGLFFLERAAKFELFEVWFVHAKTKKDKNVYKPVA